MPRFAPGAVHVEIKRTDDDDDDDDMDDEEGVAPPGWEPAVKRLKREKGVSNPWALAWWLKKKGASPGRVSAEASAENPAFAQMLAQCLAECQANQGRIPDVFVAAGAGAGWAQAYCFNTLPLAPQGL